MASIRKRLLFATLLSASGFAATLHYYRVTEPAKSNSHDRMPLAFAKNVDGNHQEKRAGSTLWTNVQEGDPLFAGDTIRTGDQGSMKVQFAKSTQGLELDSETTLMLAMNGQAIVVDLLDGYVKSQGASTAAVQLKTETGLQEIAKGSVITKEKSAPVQLANAADGKTQSRTPANTQGVTWTLPQGDLNTELNPDEPTGVDFAWSGGQPDQKISIEWGPSRKKMENKKTFSALDLKATLVLPIGRHYWRWSVAKASEDASTPLAKLYVSMPSEIIVKGLFPPAITSPTMAQVLLLKNLGESIEFKWSQQKRFDQYKLEVANEKSFASPLLVKELATNDFVYTPPTLGEYAWRLSGRSANGKWIRSRVYTFKAVLKQREKVNLKWASRGGRIDYLNAKPSIDLAWDADNKTNIKNYRLRVADSVRELANANPQVLTATKLTLTYDGPGVHYAQVQAMSPELEVIGQSPVFSYDFQPVPILRAPAFASDEAFNANARGQINISWNALEGAKDYVVDLRDPSGKSTIRHTPSPSYAFTKLLPGRYDIRITAIDQYGRSGATTPARAINVSNKSAVGTIKIKRVNVK